jgi:septal ring factor EnvC (AmiA/AmiB activator)
LARAQTSADEARKRLELLSETDKRNKELQKELQADVAQMRDQREKLNTQLLQTAKLIQASEAQLSVIESRIGELEAQEGLVRGSLESRRGSMSGLLAAMQRMGRNPPPVMVTRREDALSMVRSAMLLAAAFPELRSQAQALSEQLNEIVRIKDNIEREAKELAKQKELYQSAQIKLAMLQEERSKSLGERQRELEQVRKATAEISKSVGDLNELIGKLDKAVSDNTRLGAYEKQLEADSKRQAALPLPPVTAPDAVKPELSTKAPPPKAPAGPAFTLAPGDKLAMESPGRIQPAIPFHLAKGRVPLPAQGKRILNFGDRTQRGPSEGMVIETRHGAQIVAPNDGWVMFAGEFRSYGRILIINAGGGYHVLLAGLSNTDVQVGQFVLAGEPVGTMAAAPRGSQASQGKAQDNAPVLLIELRKDQKPINPDPWWADSAKKVQG